MTSRLTIRDARATVLVAGAVTIYLLRAVSVDVPGLSSNRMTALAVLALGALACGAGSAPDVSAEGGPRSAVGLMSLLGIAAFTLAMVAIAGGSLTVLSAFAVTVVALWTAATLRHLLTAPPPTAAATSRREELVRAGR